MSSYEFLFEVCFIGSIITKELRTTMHLLGQNFVKAWFQNIHGRLVSHYYTQDEGQKL